MPKIRRVNIKRRRRVARESRKNLKLWAEGARESILRPHIESYADAMVRGWKAERDYLQAVCTEYHARIDWRLEDFQEPSTPLPAYNPEAIPMDEDLKPDDQRAKLERIKTVNARIRRWLKYRVRSVKKQFTQTTNPRKNPYGVLMAKLSGIHAPPKALQAYQQFMRDCYSERIDPVVQERWREKAKEEGLSPQSLPTAAFWAKVSRDLYNELPPAEQVYFSKKAKGEALEAKQEYKKQVNKEISLEPESIQRCVDAIPSFLAPIIQGIQERTNFKFTIFYGGPCPRFNGEVTGHYINYGRNRAANPVPFTSYKKEHFDGAIWPTYKEWLRSSYNEEESKAAALSPVSHPPPTNFEQEFSSSEDDDSTSTESDSDSSGSETDDEQPPSKRQRTTDAAPKRFVKFNSKSKSRSGATAPAQKVQDTASTKPAQPTKPKARTRRRGNASSALQLASTSAPAVQPAHSTVSQPNAVPGRPLVSSNNANQQSPSSLSPTCPDPSSSAVVPLKIDPVVPSTDHRSLQNAASALSDPAARVGAVLSSQAGSTSATASDGASTHSALALSPTIVIQQDGTATMPSTGSASTCANGGTVDSQPLPSTTTQAQPTAATAPPSQDTTSSVTTSAQTTATIASTAGSAHPTAATTPPSQVTASSVTTSAQTTTTTASATASAQSIAATAPSTTTSAPPVMTASLPGTAGPLTAPAPASVLICPASAAQWFRDAFQSVTAQPLCSEFTEVICCFTAIELAHGFSNPPKGLSARLRPDELKRWVAGGRWRVRAPIVKDPAHFAEKWWAWWCILQPQWRETTSGPLVRPVITQIHGDTWDTLHFPGQNGILSVVATLYWWGCALVDQLGSEQHADWLAAVRDVAWILQGLLKHLGGNVTPGAA